MGKGGETQHIWASKWKQHKKKIRRKKILEKWKEKKKTGAEKRRAPKLLPPIGRDNESSKVKHERGKSEEQERQNTLWKLLKEVDGSFSRDDRGFVSKSPLWLWSRL